MKRKNLAAIGAVIGIVLMSAFLFSACGELEVAEEVELKPIIAPYISVEPKSASYNVGDTVEALTAQVWDWDAGDGALTYQWFYFIRTNAADPFPEDGDEVQGADGSGIIDPNEAVESAGIMVNSITLPLSLNPTAGDRYYYYLKIYNEDPSATNKTKDEIRSEIATLSFAQAGAAKYPIINRPPAGSMYQFGRNLVIAPLSVRATSPDGGTLTYQWSYNDNGSTLLTDRTEIEFATGAEYQPTIDLLVPGKNYFFVEVTNTTTGSTSELCVPAIVDMEPGLAAIEPVITLQPKDGVYLVDPGTPPVIEPLKVAAEESMDGGTISYQWYSNTAYPVSTQNRTVSGTAVAGATDPTFAPPTPAPNTAIYYYVVVTNTARIKSGTGRTSTVSRVVRIVYGEPADDVESNMTITVRDPRLKASRYQYIRGYGGMDVAWANFPAQTPADMELMYNPDWGLGYNMNRIMISPSNTNVNISIRDLVNSHRPNYYENVKIVNKYGGYNLASPWSPPKEWKSNNSINGGGHLVYTYRQQFANYLRAFAKHMYDAGAPIYAISISNEPNYTAGYDGCEWEPEEMRDFYTGEFVQPQPFTTGIRGYGGGKDLPRVFTMNGESANTPYINEAALLDSRSRANIDFLARHVYGETGKTLWRRSPTGTDIDAGTANNSATPNILDQPDGTKMEVWMTEHNINSANPTAYPNDSTWNYLWRFMNDVDLVMRLSNENAFVWWASKRFYSMIGDGQFGTRNGVALPRGWGLSHYAKYTNDTHRVGITLTGRFADGTTIPNIDRDASLINSTKFDLDNLTPRVTAYASIRSGKDNQPITDFKVGEPGEIGFDSGEIEYISLVLWTPTNTSGQNGKDMGTIKVQMPAGFLIGGVSAHKSTSSDNVFLPENVQVSSDRTAAFVTLGAGQLLSIKLTRLES